MPGLDGVGDPVCPYNWLWRPDNGDVGLLPLSADFIKEFLSYYRRIIIAMPSTSSPLSSPINDQPGTLKLLDFRRRQVVANDVRVIAWRRVRHKHAAMLCHQCLDLLCRQNGVGCGVNGLGTRHSQRHSTTKQGINQVHQLSLGKSACTCPIS